MKKSSKYKSKKYATGTQGIQTDQYGNVINNNDLPLTQPVNSKKSIIGGAASGASIGSSFGVYGTLIGGAVGGIVGGASAASANKSIATQNKNAAFQNFQKNNYSAVSPSQVGYAKDGLDMTGHPKKLNSKYTMIFKDGTKSIKINPANKGKFNALKAKTGESTEELSHSKNPLTRKRAQFVLNAAKWHKAADGLDLSGGGDMPVVDGGKMKLTPDELKSINQYQPHSADYRNAVWNVLGYQQPTRYPAGSEGHKKQEAQYNSAVEMINQGYRPITDPKGNKGYQSVYEKGTKAVKPVEIEGDEVVMKKVGGKFKMKGDFKGGPSHSEGGIPIVAEENDVIFPKNKRAEVVEAIQEGDNAELERIRKTLPKDKSKAKDGSTYGEDDSELADVKPKGYTPFKSAISNQYSTKIGLKSLPKSNKFSYGEDNSLANAGELAPIAYNVAKGIGGKVVKTNRRQFTPNGYTYQDNSEPLRRENNSLYNQDKQLIRNASGGNAGTYLANESQAGANKFKRLQDINNRESARKVDTQNANVDIHNQAQGMNMELNNQYDQLDLMNNARKQDFLAAGIGQLGQYSQNKQLERNLKTRDEYTLNNLQTPNYRFDPVTGKPLFQEKKGTRGIKIGKGYKMKKC